MKVKIMKVKMRTSIALLMLVGASSVSGVAVAAGQMTVFNSHALMRFEQCSLRVNRYDIEKRTMLTDAEKLKICESLEDSNFCYFGSLFDREHSIGAYTLLFSEPSICRALSEFFRRGGMAYFAPVTWTQMSCWPQPMKDYFLSEGMRLPSTDTYENNIPGTDKEKKLVGKPVLEWRNSPFAGPRPVGELLFIRHFKDPEKFGYETVVASESEGYAAVIRTRPKSGGSVVFSHVYSVERDTESPFYLNLIEGLYGKDAVRRKASRLLYLEKARSRGLNGLYIREEPVCEKTFNDKSLPDGGRELAHLDMLLARGDRELAKVVLYNCSDENYLFRLEPEKDSPNGEMFRFHDVMAWCNEQGMCVNEIVLPDNEANVISVPSGETKTFLIAAETRRKPGMYRWSFELVPVNVNAEVRKVTVMARVLDLEIDRSLLPMTYMWGPYDYSWARGKTAAYCSFLADKYNVAYVQAGTGGRHWDKLLSKNDAGKIELVKEMPKELVSGEIAEFRRGHKFVTGYGYLSAFWHKMERLGVKNADITNPETYTLYAGGIRMINAALRQAGITSNDFYDGLMDEPARRHLPQILKAASLAHELGWKVCLDIASWCSIEDEVKPLEPACDWWQPGTRRITERKTGMDELAFYRSTGKPISVGLSSMTSNDEPYLMYHRFQGIRSIYYRFDGWCNHAANSWRDNDYRGRLICPDNSSYYVHHGNNGPVATMRLEAWREGTEDFHWLKYAEKTGRASNFLSSAALKKAMEREDAAAVKRWRDALLMELAK